MQKINQIVYVTVDIYLLAEICDKYVKGKEIYFLKIDVEGVETEVLKGRNLKKYRPWTLILEENNGLNKPATSKE